MLADHDSLVSIYKTSKPIIYFFNKQVVIDFNKRTKIKRNNYPKNYCTVYLRIVQKNR
jgi:hypothetical protein